MLKDSGFKIDCHWMPNLPGSTPKKDEAMLVDQLLGIVKKTYVTKNYQLYNLVCPELSCDQWKVYPCTVAKFSKIEEWYKSGEYVPYSWEILTDILLKMKGLMFPWIRLNRIVRDIPASYVLTPDYVSNLRQDLHVLLEKDGVKCRCIRCSEVNGDTYDPKDAILNVAEYNASGGKEFFISAIHCKDSRLYGFCRLRITYDPRVDAFPELEGCALLRELHVYGLMVPTNTEDLLKKNLSTPQHSGLGKKLVAKAIEIAKLQRFKKISVISGEGVKDYYAKLGFVDTGNFMIKSL
jgi:ELP3 family radical SAM enzyme/protein acetyltransferase